MSERHPMPSPAGRGRDAQRRGEGRSRKTELPPDLLSFARQLRTSMTDAEELMWMLLRDRRLLGFKFRRQHAIAPYVLDFYCERAGLAIELDGGQHNHDEIAATDVCRTRDLEQRGIRLVRYWNDDVLQSSEEVLEDLVRQLNWREPPSPGAARHPLPVGEGRSAP